MAAKQGESARIAQGGPSPRLTMGFFCVLVIAQLLAVDHARAAGLDVRPDNTTCIAFDRPSPPGSVDIDEFEVISTSGLPLNWINSLLPGEDSVFFLGERDGRILRYDLDAGTNSVVLDLRPVISTLGEGGLLGMALHPRFGQSGAIGEGQLYLHYTVASPPSLATVIARVTSTNGGASFPIDSLEVLIAFQQENEFHNGGDLHFGPDGFLYVGIGDRGNEPTVPVSQDTTNLFGSLIRIDVDQPDPSAGKLYSIPPTNPFAGDVSGNLPEIYAWGFRQPYRWSFDALTGALWVGDVGKSDWEEVDRVVLGGNYGWPIREGAHCFEGSVCSPVGLLDPVAEYDHSQGNAIVGGFVYRGAAIAALQGVYLYADFGTGKLWGLFDEGGGVFTPDLLFQFSSAVFGFGQGLDGEIYVLTTDGVHKLIPGTGGGGTAFPQLLSETGCVDPADPTQMSPGLIPYDVVSKLYSDDAMKDRWVGLPNGTDVTLLPDGDFEFPIGTVLVKNFALDGLLIETRLFMRHADGGWAGYSYAWDESETDASLLAGLLERDLGSQVWTYPSRAQCLQCHTAAANHVLGPETGQLNHPFIYPVSGEAENQLTVWDQIDVLAAPLPAPVDELARFPDPGDSMANQALRARSYLHSNCSGCHRPGSGLPTAFDLRIGTPFQSMGVCDVDPLEGDLGIPGAKLLAPGDPSTSILSVRQHRTDAAVMPPIGRSLVDPVGTSVVDAWITSVKNDCSGPDSDGDGFVDADDNCPDVSNPGQEDGNANGIGDACENLPDYEVTAVRGPIDVVTGQVVSLEADTTNSSANDGPGGTLEVRFYLSVDSTIDPATDFYVGSCIQNDLGAGAQRTCAESLTVPVVPAGPPPQGYSWGACVDDPNAVEEGSEGNNCAAGQPVLVPEPAALPMGWVALATMAGIALTRDVLRRRAHAPDSTTR